MTVRTRILSRTASVTERSASTATAAAVVGALVLTLTGCAGIQHLLQNEHEETFATYAEAEDGWVGVDIPPWIPRDASDLHNLATNDEQVSVVRVATSSQPEGSCTPADRRGLPALTAEWSAEKFPATVMVCGDYELMPMDDGWLGWFNATAEGDVPGD